jgi:hypothetical protein
VRDVKIPVNPMTVKQEFSLSVMTGFHPGNIHWVALDVRRRGTSGSIFSVTLVFLKQGHNFCLFRKIYMH